MTLADAVALIKNDSLLGLPEPQQWADLGCGNGLFSRALLQLLPPSSTVHAVDRQFRSFTEISIQFYQLDFEKTTLPFTFLNGILIANALHYIEDKLSVLKNLKNHLQPGGVFIIVEYDQVQSNRWVPFPVNFSSLQKLFAQAGFDSIEKINEHPSLYNRGDLYSAYIYNKKDV